MEDEQNPLTGFKPNIYPVMYWALVYGVLAGVLLFVIYLLQQYITIIWFPIFLVGLVLGGFRNYKKQKTAWLHGQGMTVGPTSFASEIREAVSDITVASQEMIAEERAAQQQEEPIETTENDQYPPDQQSPQPPIAPPPAA